MEKKIDNIEVSRLSQLTDDKFSSIPFKIGSLRLFSDYYGAYYGASFKDHSFVIHDSESVLAMVLVYEINKKLSLPQEGVEVKLFIANQKQATALCKVIIERLQKIAVEHCCTGIVIKDNFSTSDLSPLGEILFNQKFCSRLTFEMLVGYKNFSEDSYHQGIRRRYKSFVNWGKKNLNFEIINNDNLSIEKFLDFKSFHLKISGRKTRCDETWAIQYEMIKKGIAELMLGYYKENLVAGSLFADQDDVSIYSTGVYERELFDFGISHSLLYHGICRSYSRGNTSKFSLGYFDTDIKDSKWYNIQFFKKGFSESLGPTVLWSKALGKGEVNE